MILEDILNQKQIEIQKLKKHFIYNSNNNYANQINLSFFREKLKKYKNKGFYEYLKKKSKVIIAECKKASPSGGILKNHYDPVKIAHIYEKLGASAISVLTDEKFFLGSIEDLQKVSDSVHIPVLRKDFILSEIQIYESILYGADAVLLIARILDNSTLEKLIQTCINEKIDYILEIHSEEELQIALRFPVKIIGINHRNLDTLEINLNLSKKLAPLIRKHNKDILIIAESGIEDPNIIKELSNIVDGFLIGTYFMKSPNIEESWKFLFSKL